MTVRLNPHLGFRDSAAAAMEFYRGVFGGELTSTTFGESGMGFDDAESSKILHAMLVTPNDLVLMAADAPNSMELGTNGTISLSGDDESELRGYWDALSDGATPGVPLEKAPWGDTFGMLTDKFGIEWMVNISGS